LKDLWKWSYQ